MATIVGTSGSTPAPSDSKMLVHAGVRIAGTIGGGCLDSSVIEVAAGINCATPAQILTFSLDDDTGDTGLNCGGKVDVLIESVSPGALALYETALSTLDSGESCFCITALPEKDPPSKSIYSPDGDCLSGKGVPEGILIALREFRTAQAPVVNRLTLGETDYVIEHLQAKPGVIIFGGGHVGKAVVQCASLAGFHITIVDDRQAYANKERFPEADMIVCEPFDQVCSWLKATPSTYVVIVTRGHKHDAMVLECVLRHDVKYVGMIGSRRKVAGTYEQLKDRGIPTERMTAVHAPVGLDIRAVTAEEIGISIVAEMIAVRRNADLQAIRSMKSR